ncbi:ultra-long-chain fatty acid omega-hydroxylase-like [Amphiura filiformis]|uniref:ultra-long-chain fatty acid omega-hydroxylase-like n=1 Tax=Amphiura filiformis TaxID=82378 RepID=UPI003B21A5C4
MTMVMLLVKLGQLIRRRMAFEKALAAFPVAPERHWLLGHLPKLTGNLKEKRWGMEAITVPYPKYCVLWAGPFLPIVLVYHHEAAKAILSTSEPKEDYIFDMIRPWLGDGLLLSYGKKWARNRRLLTPGFHFDVLRPYAKIFQGSANDLVSKWRRMYHDGEPLSREMFTDVSLLTLDSLLKCIFSVESNCQEEAETNQKHPYIRGVVELSQLIMARFRFLPHHIDLLYHLSYNGYKWRQANNLVHSYTRSVIQKRKDAIQHPEAIKDERKYVDFLDILLSAKDEDGSGLTDQEIQDEVDTFMFEGHDTTSSGLSWFLFNMAIRPEIQVKCQKEVDDYFRSKGKDQLDWDDLNNLPYLTMCLKESMRMNPPVPNIARRLTRDLTFPDGNVVPAGAFITTIIMGVHHSPLTWKEAELFIPERFSSENLKNMPPYSYVPFSAGPRNCIGQNFAMNEMKITLATLLHNFDFTLNPAVKVDIDDSVIQRAANGIHLFIKPRTLQD